MKIRCNHCGEYFYPNDETMELIADGWLATDSINTCDECFEMLKNPFSDDLEEMFSDADPGLKN